MDFQFYSSWIEIQKLGQSYLSICPNSSHNKKKSSTIRRTCKYSK